MENNNLYFLEGGGEMGELTREKDWAITSMGPPNVWPQSLRTTLHNLLNSLFPMFLFWGPELTCFYNDAYRPSLGDKGKHPSILGKGAREAWPEIWDDIAPMIDRVMTKGESVWNEDMLLPIFRNGRMEDVYWTFCNSPVCDDTGRPIGVLVVCNETTAAVMANQRLTESEQRFRTMANGSSIMISVGDENGNALYFNDAWTDFSGKAMEYFLDSGWSKLIHPDDRSAVVSTFDQHLSDRTKWETECRLLAKNGKYRWVSIYVSPRFLPDGNFAGYISSAIDTHKRKLLAQQEMKYRFMADNASDSLILMCEDGSFEYLNGKALEKLGYTEKEAESLTVMDVDRQYDKTRFENLFNRAQREEVPIFETVHRAKDGTEYPVEAKVSGFIFNGDPHMLAIARDISERKNAEKNLRDSEYRFRELADQAPMWIWITDADVKVEYANRHLLDYIGIKNISDFTGQVWEDIVHPEDIQVVYEGFADAVAKRRGFTLDYRVRKAETGIYEWFTVKGVPRFEGKELAGFIGTGMNVHRQKTFSEQLRKEVDMRTGELAEINIELKKSNKELQSFAYISSHDLQEPLRKIQTFCSILLVDEYDRLSQSGKNKFERMESAANRMQTLIDDLLAYSRLETEERKFEVYDLATLLEDVKIELEEELRSSRAVIRMLGTCQMDVVHFQFRQLLHNLISNSIKYSREYVTPIIEIKCDTLNRSELSFDRKLPHPEYVQVSLSDNGIGFDNGHSKRIFEVFKRLHGKERYKGTGVGLAIVKKIAENHEGFVTAKGDLGNGAIFEVYIPKRDNS